MKHFKGARLVLCAIAAISMFAIGCGGGDSSSDTPVAPVLSNACDMTSFTFTSPAATGTITGTSVAITVPYGTSVTALVASFVVSADAKVTVGSTAQTSGTTPNNYTSTVNYKVTAADGTTSKTYGVTVTVAPGNVAQLTGFSFASPAATGSVNESAKTVSITVPYGTSTTLAASFSALGTVTVGGLAQSNGITTNNFANPVTYRVTSPDDTVTVDYIVTVTIAPASSLKAITAFSFTSPSATGIITGNAIAISVPTGTSVTALVATFTLSPYASASVVATGPQTSGSTANDFTSPVVYTVTAQDGSTQDYTVTVTVSTGPVTVLYANFQTLPSGLTDNTESTYAATAVPTVTNTNGYSITFEGKLKYNITTVPTTGSGFSTGCIQFSNNATTYGKVSVTGVQGPFTLVINHVPSTVGDFARKLRVMVGGSEVYYFCDADFNTCTYVYTGSDVVSIEAYGWNGTKGAGVRIFDFTILK
jgi:hypothetical protein